MSRLIDADALVENIKSEIDDDKEIYPDDKTSIVFRAGMKTVIRIVKNQDTVDTVKHGHWVHVDELPSGDYFKCSECNNHIFLKFGWKVSFESPADKYKYCPNCGTRMENNAND